MRNVKSQSGFSLVELLVATVVIAVGIVGTMGMQSQSVTQSFESLQRTRATYLASDMLERIRANKSEIINYIGTNYGDTSTTFSPEDCISNAGEAEDRCNTGQLAVFDKYQWHNLLLGADVTNHGNNTSGLISPRGCVYLDRATGVSSLDLNAGQVTVVVTWGAKEGMQDGLSGKSINVQGTAFDISGCGTASNKRRHVVVSSYVY
mgnify:CR=1 FL=1